MSEETQKKEGTEGINNEELGPLADDWFGKHHIITRIIAFVIIGVFVYVFMVPLPVEYAEIIMYGLVFVFIAITFGINSLKLIIELVKAWRGK